MRPLTALTPERRRAVRFVLADIDDTMTTDGRLTARAYGALESLAETGIAVVPVTGRPAGWCDMIARFWPVEAVIGENGAFWFRYDHKARRMHRRYWADEAQRARARTRLDALGRDVLAMVPGAAIASDQAYRAADLAIDFREDVAALPRSEVDRIVALLEREGATARISSIHVNAWFGAYDKLAMTRALFAEAFGLDLDAARERIAFIGDSPNDEPMFAFFPNSIGVANVRDFVDRLAAPPAFVTEARSGEGFAEFAAALLDARQSGRSAAPQ